MKFCVFILVCKKSYSPSDDVLKSVKAPATASLFHVDEQMNRDRLFFGGAVD